MAMTLKFTALIRKEENTDFWIDVRDLPSYISYGETENQTKTNFKEVLATHLEYMREEGQELPTPHSRDEVLCLAAGPARLLHSRDYVISRRKQNSKWCFG